MTKERGSLIPWKIMMIIFNQLKNAMLVNLKNVYENYPRSLKEETGGAEIAE
jgi:hypothetical protein